jgi:hypothetical protein
MNIAIKKAWTKVYLGSNRSNPLAYVCYKKRKTVRTQALGYLQLSQRVKQ